MVAILGPRAACVLEFTTDRTGHKLEDTKFHRDPAENHEVLKMTAVETLDPPSTLY